MFRANAGKVDHFFMVSAALRFDPCLGEQVKCAAPREQEGGSGSLETTRAFLEQAPLACPGPEAMLPLEEDAVNPCYRQWVASLKEKVLGPVLGLVPDRLSEADWERVKSFFAFHGAHWQARPRDGVDALAEEKLRVYRDGGAAARAKELVAADSEVAGRLRGVGECGAASSLSPGSPAPGQQLRQLPGAIRS